MTESRCGLFGVRHHGPGSARSLLAALDDFDPAIVLIEGPADASDLLHFAAAPGMVPPVAILAHSLENPANAIFFPFAVYSPEWQALKWGLARQRTIRFMDLPASSRLALRAGTGDNVDAEGAPHDQQPSGEDGTAIPAEPGKIRRDPLSYLAGIAGYEDGEAWWNALIEQGSNGPAIFAAIETAMTELRRRNDLDAGRGPEEQRIEDQREAHMRLAIAAALKETDGRVAVVCGAWHVPALRELKEPAEDRTLLKGIAKIKISVTWVPWTETRLAMSTGYGAGVVSPGWYAHVWNAGANKGASDNFARAFTSGWQVKVAALLRRSGRPAPTASAIEAVRLAEALASMRDLALPGLEEMQAAALATLCLGEPAPMALVTNELVIGGAVGSIAEGVPLMPLAADLAYWQKRLKLRPEALDREVALDLRVETGLAKSHLLHRLGLLGVAWGRLQGTGSSRGTFREIWVLRWDPEFSVALAEALVHGTTIEQAAGNAAIVAARRAPSLATISDLVRGCLLAGLDDAARVAIYELQARAATTSDVESLASAVPPLVTILRYGTARATSVEELELLVISLAETVCAGLVYACRQLQPPEAEKIRQTLVAFNQALLLLERMATTDAWQNALQALANDRQGDDLLRGFAVRTLYDHAILPADRMAGYLGRALSPAVLPLEASRWLEGFLGQSGEVLLHDTGLQASVDTWLTLLDDETFLDMLPMLRRAFSNLDRSERRSLLDAIVRRPATLEKRPAATPDPSASELAPGFVAALPLLLTILGLDGKARS